MKRSPRATIRRRSGGEASVSLFPFLAVLLCTMGALVVLLVVITRQARLQAASIPIAAEKTQQLEDLETARERARWRIGELKASREKTEAQLADMRRQLDGAEDHARQLRERLAQLENAWSQLDSTREGSHRQREELEAELVRLRAEIEDAKRRLAEAQDEAQTRVSYAVIPYEGPNGTHRRPIYLECRRDAVVLQPERIVFTAADFNGPLGPGNPLDMALRATREYLERNRIVGGGSNEPYPLLLVRPNGIEAYYAARAAMASWTTDFGYELIGEDWELEFMPPDPELANTVGQVVGEARVRQRRLALAVPRHYEEPKPKYRPAPYRGGVILDSGSESEPSGLLAQRPAPRFGNRAGHDALESPGEPTSHEGMLAGGLPPEKSFGRPNRPRQEAASPPVSDGAPIRPGEWIPQPANPPSEPPGEATVDDQPPCLAETRGKDWGLPDAARGSVPVTRPIHIDLYHDRLIIVPEQGMTHAKVVPLGPKTVAAVDGMVSALWELMDSWGIAGRGMYWRPILNFYVAPGADDRYHELATLLDGSGLEVRRK